MNLRKKVKSLQTALCQRGRVIRINQTQYYSAESGHFGTIYQVCETVVDDATGKKKTVIHCKSPRLLDVVLALRALWEDGG